MAQSLFKVLIQQRPECRITVLAPSWSEPVLARMPEVTSSIAMPVGHGRLEIAQRWRLSRTLKSQFDQAIVLPGSFKSALIPWFARIKQRTGFIGEQRYGLLNDYRKLDQGALPFSVQRFVALGHESGQPPIPLDRIPWPVLEIESDRRQQICNQFGLNDQTPIIALCPGAEYGPAKQWPPDYFAEVARYQLGLNRQVVILGSEKDQAAANLICRIANGCIDLTGKTSLGDAIDLMSAASHVVTNDSGLMHVAAAVGCHVVAIYGSSSDAFTPPLTNTADRLYLDLPCRPCFQRHCPLGHLDCLHKLEAAQVIEVLNK